ncbi:GHMP kinase [Jiella sp. MQZ9-1]|uniref:beta-ribofuranosylaminobenzene 5'-phosphate synthase family protein n=1 Tax=Jiella flava TaxID=2816857 RepID=UPI001E61B1F8|nr:beta-ribofuranosylaminobenzene 5'-phosphate synthase family protein [Jiella flava]MCD2471959.1 GHMP kinase [Jiella flava]
MIEDVVIVSAPARLHLGFLDPGGSLGRRFGGIGLALDAPSTTIAVQRASRDSVAGPHAERAARHLDTMRRALGLRGAYALTIDTAMPAHAGLGSGTQLALAIACALRRLEGCDLAPDQDAALLGRGNRSGLGTAFITGGGVAVDGGRGDRDLPPPLIARLPFPDDWRVILVMDPRQTGVHGQDELDAFAALPPFAESDAARICQLVLLRALPGLGEHDLDAFGAAIAEIQEKVGAHFATAQGGVFSSDTVAAACTWLAANGARGIGQSSWGPTGFAFAPSNDAAEALVAQLSSQGLAEALEIRVARGRNRGVEISSTAALGRRVGTSLGR